VNIPARHQALIDKFVQRGFVAMFRRWALGDTVFVATGTRVLEDGIVAYDRSLYVFPSGDNDWQIDIGPWDPTAIRDAELVARVEQLLTSRDEYDRQFKQLARDAYERSKMH
jgi:hypothetical protein